MKLYKRSSPMGGGYYLVDEVHKLWKWLGDGFNNAWWEWGNRKDFADFSKEDYYVISLEELQEKCKDKLTNLEYIQLKGQENAK